MSSNNTNLNYTREDELISESVAIPLDIGLNLCSVIFPLLYSLRAIQKYRENKSKSDFKRNLYQNFILIFVSWGISSIPYTAGVIVLLGKPDEASQNTLEMLLGITDTIEFIVLTSFLLVIQTRYSTMMKSLGKGHSKNTEAVVKTILVIIIVPFGFSSFVV